ncbi:hypothetical protein SBRY_50270 [Actinacidiphila bryophytorum]|uniref:Uncharacterized protein n=1 Tax=Actinacidiphila bryophytorum TaxID=1436133 RepID=A0A9W4H4H1_9ACTN|nr:hypothetical protein SBRY_50270 [Actinacidiphila bryophytorum]
MRRGRARRGRARHHFSRDSVLRPPQNLFRLIQNLAGRAHRFTFAAAVMELLGPLGPLRRATVVPVAVVVPSASGFRPAFAPLKIPGNFRSFPVGIIIAATRYSHRADAGALPRRRMT